MDENEYFYKGKKLFEVGEYSEALKFTKKAISLKSSNEKYWDLKSNIEVKIESYNKHKEETENLIDMLNYEMSTTQTKRKSYYMQDM